MFTSSILLALADGLMLHNSIDPGGFRWHNIRAAVDVLLDGIATPEWRPEPTDVRPDS